MLHCTLHYCVISFVMGNNWNERGSISKYTLGCIKRLRTNGLLKRRLFQFLSTLSQSLNGLLEYGKTCWIIKVWLFWENCEYSAKAWFPFWAHIKASWNFGCTNSGIVCYFMLLMGDWKRRCGLTGFWRSVQHFQGWIPIWWGVCLGAGPQEVNWSEAVVSCST